IYKRYLKAGVILVSLLMIAVAVANVAVGLILRGDLTVPLEASALAAALSLSLVSFDTMAMMTFSSLQKPRAGANQPLGLALGGLLVLPAYLTAFIFPGIVAVAVDLARRHHCRSVDHAVPPFKQTHQQGEATSVAIYAYQIKESRSSVGKYAHRETFLSVF
ncbi:MAG: hypothetical protein ACLQAL_08285, partial [Halobacteriota archaeon]